MFKNRNILQPEYCFRCDLFAITIIFVPLLGGNELPFS